MENKEQKPKETESSEEPVIDNGADHLRMDSIRPWRDPQSLKVDLKHGPAGAPVVIEDENTPQFEGDEIAVKITASADASTTAHETLLDDHLSMPLHSHHERQRKSGIVGKIFGTHPLRRSIVSIFVLMVIGGLGFGAYVYGITNSQIVEGGSDVGFFGQIHRIVDEDVEPLNGEDEDRVNIALLGRGGLNHPGGTLIDTIMVASIKPSTNQVALLSLPRDLVVPFQPDEESSYIEYRKINYIMELGGIDFAMDTLQEVTGLKIHYYVLADFKGFRDVIDTLGGLDVTVDNAFADSQYPDYNYGYQTIAFEEGVQVMDGETALQYARSRHGNNGEGSDFARAARQQKILEGFRDTALSASTIFNPAKISGILGDVGDNVSTNMEIWEMSRFAQVAQDVDQSTVINKVVDNGLSGLVYSEISSETGAYVLIPRAGLANFSEINALAVNIFGSADVVKEQAVVAVQNGTTIAGLAGRTATVLEGAGVVVNGVTNAAVNTVPNTVVYQLSADGMENTTAILEEQLGVTVVHATRPAASDTGVRLATELDGTLVDLATLPSDADFVIILGKDQDRLNIVEPLL